MSIKITYGSETIKFHPYKWHFEDDGEWGHIFFHVKKGIFEYGSNNGFYCMENTEDTDWCDCDIVHAATPCMDNEEDIAIETVQGFLNRAASALFDNLTRLKATTLDASVFD